MSEPRWAADRNLLFGVLALQMGFIARDDLTAALRDWSRDRDQPRTRRWQPTHTPASLRRMVRHRRIGLARQD